MLQRIPKSLLALAASAALLVGAAGCSCRNAPPRFWKAQDRTSGTVGYTVDTVAVPLGTRLDAVFLDAQGHELTLGEVDLTPMSEAEWREASGNARIEHGWCPNLKACWALPLAK